MSSRSKIEWTENTWNPVTGCTKLSPGCKFCYAETLARRLQRMGATGYEHGFALTLHPERLRDPIKRRKPTIWFVNSMSDLFHEGVPFAFIDQVFATIEQTPQHRYQVLTKRPERMADYFGERSAPGNAWLGTSIENRKHGVPRIAVLRQIVAQIRFLSIEPLLEDVGALDLKGISWVIVGGESGARARPMKPEWARSIRDQCEKAKVPFFFKQWGSHGHDGVRRAKGTNGRLLDGRTYDSMPARGSSVPQQRYDWLIGHPLPEIGAHSLAKHRILRRYIERYIEILTAITWQEQLSLTFVDGYAGGGRYRFGRQTAPGSPLILLETVAAMEAKLSAARPKGFRINAEFIFVDNNRAHTDFLRAEIESSPFKTQLDRSVRIVTADFNEKVDEIIRAVQARSPRAGRAIFLLDQFGWSQVAFRSIRAILDRLVNAEVFLTFSVDALINYLSENSYQMSAFGEIDVDAGLVRELLQIKQAEQRGYRALIQNALYAHVQAMTGAPFYSPFFIKSPEAHRSYWFIHLSQHREARNEIGLIHWAENNTTVHHGGAGLNALGFASGATPDQLAIDYLFDEHAKALSRAALKEQLPRLIFDTAPDTAPTLEELFATRCNDTPVVRPILEDVLVDLRREREIMIVDEAGRAKPRARTFDWTDRIVLSPQRSFFGPFSMLSKQDKKS